MKRIFNYSIATCAVAIFAVVIWLALMDRGCRYDAAEAGLRSVEMKLLAYQLDTGELPESLNELLINNGKAGWNGPYAREQDLLDPWHQPIHYETVKSARLWEVSPNDNRRSLEIR